MLTRVITAIVALCILLPILFLADTWVLPVAVAVCCFIAIYEVLKCIGVLSKPGVSVSLFILSVAAPIFVRIIGTLELYILTLMCTFFVEILYLMAVMVFSKGNITIEQMSVSAFMSFYVIFGFTSIVLLHDCFNLGKHTYLLVFVGAWVTDVFAYFCGRLFGKHKLIPEVSPKKTVEGSIGGTVFSGLAFILFGFILGKLNVTIELGYVQLFVFGIVAAIVAQIGDLSMSALKRRYGIKDFGNVFPGHGGMLDRFDSILAVAIVLFVLNIIVTSM